MKIEIEIGEDRISRCARCGREEAPIVHGVNRNHEGNLAVTGWASPEGWGEIDTSGACGHGRYVFCPDCSRIASGALVGVVLK
jgi:hypothetical protein